MGRKILFTLLFVLFFSNQNAVALDLQVTVTNETCTGNGSLAFTVTNQVPNVPIFYSIYLLPNSTTPIATVSGNSHGGLVSGNYLVIASQTVNGVQTTASQNATINNNVVPFTFTITGTKVLCGNDGVITVNASSTAVSYQILTGPVTTGAQSSNVFSGLPAGIYNIRVIDNCGEAKVQTFTLLTSTASLIIFSPVLVQVLSCNLINVSHNIAPSANSLIAYPLTVQTTVNPPTGPAIVTTQTITSGNVFNLTIPAQNNQSYPYNILITDACGNNFILNNNILNYTPIQISPPTLNNTSSQLSSCTSFDISHELTLDVNNQFYFPLSVQTTVIPTVGSPIITNQVINSGTIINVTVPMENNTSYSYNLLVTDACGNTYELNDNVLAAPFDVTTTVAPAGCNGSYVNFSLLNYGPPFNIIFISAPVGFNPANYNSNFPGPYTDDSLNFGNQNNSLPIGIYVVQITDLCGNTSQQSFEIIPPQASVVQETVTNPACGGTGSITLMLVPYIEISTINLVAAPTNYPNSIPENVSQFINANGALFMDNLPIGTYTFNMTDVCGDTYSHTVSIVPTASPISLINRVGCEIGLTSVVIGVANSSITFIEILNAPFTFGFALPYNVSSNIAGNGSFYMNSLPEGDYKFRIIDNCGFDRIYDRTIEGLNAGNTTMDITEYCGLFELQLTHTSNANYLVSFWLQKYNEIDGVWEHPSTGFDYVPGSNLTVANAVPLTNNANNSLAYTGKFRVVKMYYNYSNGIANLNRCISILDEFEFKNEPKIITVYAFPCLNNTQEVVVIAEGLGPLLYSITEKNGASFIVNNGTSNAFSGLDVAIYNFRVEDLCGNWVNIDFDVSLLQEPEIIASNLCNGTNGQLEIQDFPFVTYEWYNVQNPTVILSTSSTLEFTPFNSTTDAGTYAVQLSTTNPNSCINQTIEYIISPNGFNPNAGDDNAVSICRENTQLSLNTFLANPHDNGGTWTDSNGDPLSAIINPIDFTVGNHAFTYTVNGFCAVTDDALITITIKDLPASPVLSAPSPICEGDDVLLEASLIANATYFWTGPNGFTSTDQNPLITSFDSANDGTYFVYTTVDGCNSATEQIVVNSNPIPDFSIDGTTSICIGQNETLTITPTNFNVNSVTIEWYYENSLLSTTTPTLQISQIGNYSIIINNNGCENQKDIEIIEKINSFDVVLEQGCNGKNYEINIINSSNFSNATYSWTGPNGFVAFTQNIVVPNLEIGTYNVEVTDALGCKSSSSAVVENTNCFIPNGFSPDDDGINDFFDLTGYNVKKIYVYNRYGRLVYDKDNYINEWKGQTNDNKRLPASTYYYVLEFNEGESKTGWVYVSY
ncbi:gliding motility-associated C-terminal domain-containing protein [uncultured Flavobacterium sp.]|uniref:gliding motility-associated C-terminal domain-containing protein n=1 Tax=uncultured Flavobacterium sp. TaxID=165435 RepID=UPI0030C7B97D